MKTIVAIIVFARKWWSPDNGWYHSANITILYSDKSQDEFRVEPEYGSEYLTSTFKLLAKEFVVNPPSGVTTYKHLEDIGATLIVECCEVKAKKHL